MDEREIVEQDLARRGGEASNQTGAEPPITAAPALTSTARRLLRVSRKVGVAVMGGSVVLLGVAFLFLPAPGSVVIPLGLALLATEFSWARRLLRHVKTLVARAAQRAAVVSRSRSIHRPGGDTNGVAGGVVG
jgi:uncharacterized protein (TIGR02611 family)